MIKPGILFGNIVTAAAGCALASKSPFDCGLFVAALLGLTFIMGSACIWNNYFDREIDKKMERTRDRALVKGELSCTHAIVFSLVLLLLGVLTLGLYTNSLALTTALVGFFSYVALYGFLKYRTVHATLIGSISGAVPPLVGYFALTPHFDAAACLLFLMVVLWQMPHFYAIAIYRLEDYARASMPVLPLVRGVSTTKIHMMVYLIAFVITTLMLPLYSSLGYSFFIVALLLGIAWIAICLRGFMCTDDVAWAKKVFLFSLIVICSLSFMIGVDRVLI